MTDNILVKTSAATQTYKNPIAVRFFKNLDSASKKIGETEKLPFSIIESILGAPPTIPSSPDMDARLEAYEEYSRYCTKATDIESKLRNYARKIGS